MGRTLVSARQRLSELDPGTAAQVTCLRSDPGTRTHLMELGVLPGETVSVVRRAPFGCPVVIDVQGAVYSLPRALAETIEVDGIG